MNSELPDVQAGFRKGKGATDQIANICWIIEKAREFQKNIDFCFIDYAKAFDCVYHNKLENSERDGNTRPPDLPLEKPIGHGTRPVPNRKRNTSFSVYGHPYMVPNRKKSTSNMVHKLYGHPAYLIYMQSTS